MRKLRVVMDYPQAWAFVNATKPGDHHPNCSWRLCDGAMLCDCDVLWDEYGRRGGSDPRADNSHSASPGEQG